MYMWVHAVEFIPGPLKFFKFFYFLLFFFIFSPLWYIRDLINIINNMPLFSGDESLKRYRTSKSKCVAGGYTVLRKDWYRHAKAKVHLENMNQNWLFQITV